MLKFIKPLGFAEIKAYFFFKGVNHHVKLLINYLKVSDPGSVC